MFTPEANRIPYVSDFYFWLRFRSHLNDFGPLLSTPKRRQLQTILLKMVARKLHGFFPVVAKVKADSKAHINICLCISTFVLHSAWKQISLSTLTPAYPDSLKREVDMAITLHRFWKTSVTIPRMQ